MEEPRKLFKTISLEERLAASAYNVDPIKPRSAKGGSVTFKTTANTPNLYSQDLKRLQIGGVDQVIPTVGRTARSLTTQLNIPAVNTTFPSSISLRDRLSQTNITKTAHLPQYFLSDQYTGYLNIGPFNTPSIATQNIGEVQTITLSGIVDNQTNNIVLGTTPTTDTVLVSQGTINTIGSFNSLTPDQPVISVNNNLLTQGTYFTLGQYLSFINPTTPGTVVQGSVTITPYSTTPNQGPGVTPFNPLTTNDIALLQGLLITNGVLVGSAISLVEPVAGITLENSPAPNISTIFATSALEDGVIPQINVLGFEADRALAFLAPKIKHGSANVNTNFETDPNRNPPKESTSPAVGPFETDPNRNPPKDSTSPAIDEDQPQTIIGQENVQDISNAVEAGVTFPKSNQGSIAAYNALTYGQIIQKQEQVAAGGGLGSQRSSKMSPQVGQGRGAVQGVRDQPGALFDDFINITIRGGNRATKFRAYLDSFSDSFNAEWSDVNYVGRQDTLKQFKGVTRSVSFAIKLPAFSSADVKANFNKLNYMIGMTQVGRFGNGSTYIEGPLCQLTLGNMFVKTWCVFNSVKIDFDPKEVIFDIDEELPQLLNVSFDATILASNNNELFNGTTNFYYGNSDNNLGLRVG